ncbi:MAG: hypothetical protein JWO52_2555 [Gammaproteobacteria bacterium]|nr:hypothetical protein [Gammaproteobacteria bacterium]
MRDSEKAVFTKQLLGLAAMKPGAKLTPEAIEIWWQSMRHDWELEDFKAAAAHLSRAMEFMPNPYHFDQLRKAARPTAAEAWIQARAAAGSCYVGGPIGFGSGGTCGNPFIDRVVQSIGGYRTIALHDTDKLHYLERRFTENYKSLQNAEDVRQAVPQISGPSRLKLIGPSSVGALLLPKSNATHLKCNTGLLASGAQENARSDSP